MQDASVIVRFGSLHNGVNVPVPLCCICTLQSVQDFVHDKFIWFYSNNGNEMEVAESFITFVKLAVIKFSNMKQELYRQPDI